MTLWCNFARRRNCVPSRVYRGG